MWFILLLPLMLLFASPLTGRWLILLAPCLLLFYWGWCTLLQQLKLPATASLYWQMSTQFPLGQRYQLQWFTPKNMAGELIAGGLISTTMLRLDWRCQQSQQRCRRWVFADQCTPEQYRALARAIAQCNWQPASQKLA